VARVAEAVEAGPNADARPRAVRGRAEADNALLHPPDPTDRAREPPRTELSPRPRPDFGADAPLSEPHAGTAEPVQPTITIGHVTVEIVDETRPGPVAPRPLTAASASVIGPLGQARAARRLIALRRV
jgi:hypothetical protein